MQLKIEAVCDVGIKRKVNQDMVLVGNEYFREMDNDYGIEIEPNARPFFIAVSDGMGGHQAGEIASELVLNKSSEFVQLLKNGLSEAQLTKAITEFYTKLHKEFMDEGEKGISKKGMGATLVGLLFYSEKVYLINIGDSRCYRFRNGILKQLSKDHSLAEVSGIQRKQSHILLNSIGGGDAVFVDLKEMTPFISSGDNFILCSDGLTDMLPDEVIETILNRETGAHPLLEEAKKAGGKDNISIVLISILC